MSELDSDAWLEASSSSKRTRSHAVSAAVNRRSRHDPSCEHPLGAAWVLSAGTLTVSTDDMQGHGRLPAGRWYQLEVRLIEGQALDLHRGVTLRQPLRQVSAPAGHVKA